MINVTPEFIDKMWTDRSFDYAVTITFQSGAVVTLGADDLCVTGCHITTSAGTSALPLGNAFCMVLELQFFNRDDQYKDYDFFMASVHVVLNYQLSETAASIDLGTYTVTEPETYGSIITIKAYDHMYKADKPFTGTITFPTTAALLFAEACYDSGLAPITTTFANSDFTIDALPDQITNRQIIGAIAMLAGGNALIRNGGVSILTYTLDSSTIEVNYYGGIFDAAEPSYETGDDVDGGSFNPWDEGAAADGGTIADLKIQQFFSEVISQTVCTDDVVITGIRTKTEDGTEHLSGSEGYVLDITNPLIDGKEEAAAIAIGRLLIGIQFRPFELTTMAYPLAEFGDLCYIQHKDVKIASMITDIEYQLKGATTIKCSADSPLRNSSKNYVGDANIQTLIAARRAAERQISRYDVEVQRMTGLILNSFGAFETKVVTPSGGTIYYTHDKPELENSENIWVRTAEAFMVSHDGGNTWVAGMDADGHVVANILSAVGISADWIKTGHMSADKIEGGHISANLIEGGTLRLDGNDSNYGKLVIYNSSGTPIIANLNDGLMIGQSGYLICSPSRADYADFGSVNSAFLTNGEFFLGAKINNNFNKKVRMRVLSSESIITSPYTSTVERTDISFKDGVNALVGSYGQCLSLSAHSDDTSDPYIILVNPQGYKTFSNLTIADNFRINGKNSKKYYPYVIVEKDFGAKENVYIEGNLYVTGDDKTRVIDTENYSARLQYCYETASPYFGDIGTGRTDENGECYIFFDDIFRETISTGCEYVVFLQKEGSGDVWVEEKADEYFLVKGTPDTAFAWELKAKQEGSTSKRLEQLEQESDYQEAIPDDGYTEPDYGAEGAQLIEDYINAQEGITT